eukprot:SAG31_NODE_7689_length_1616_cov_3.029664_1_plen_127_part_00
MLKAYEHFDPFGVSADTGSYSCLHNLTISTAVLGSAVHNTKFSMVPVFNSSGLCTLYRYRTAAPAGDLSTSVLNVNGLRRLESSCCIAALCPTAFVPAPQPRLGRAQATRVAPPTTTYKDQQKRLR